MIVKRNDKYVLLSSTSNKVLGVHNTKDEALAQERAIAISKKKHNKG